MVNFWQLLKLLKHGNIIQKIEKQSVYIDQ